MTGNIVFAAVDGVSTNLYAYDVFGNLTNEVQNGVSIARTFDRFGRPTGYAVLEPETVNRQPGTTQRHTVAYAYDALGRFASVTSGTNVFEYSRLPDSDLVTGYSCGPFRRAVSYEPHRDLISAVTNTFGSALISAFDYANDAAARRVSRLDTFDGAATTNTFGYNARSEVTAAAMGTNTYRYAYDPIGNRISSFHNAETNAYAANSLNQYIQISNLCASVSLCEPTYDADGNMTSDGRGWHYFWNGENRMVCASNADVSVTYSYDHRGRMVRKGISCRVGETRSIGYTWDDWNIIHENNVSVLKTNVVYNIWGLDVDGTFQGVGGVGGLLATIKSDVAPQSFQSHDTSTYTRYLPTYDGNGNISDYISDAKGTIVAHYGYSPFGGTVTVWGELADFFTHRFSTKPSCDITCLKEYVYRKYSTDSGRWISRDPLLERGNIYLIAYNSLVLNKDYLGLFVPQRKNWYSCHTTRLQSFDIHKKLPILGNLNAAFDMNFSAEYKKCLKCCAEGTRHAGDTVNDWEVDVGMNVRFSISGGTFHYHFGTENFGGWWSGATADAWVGIYAEGGIAGSGSFSGGSDLCNDKKGVVGGCVEGGGYFQLSGGGQLAIQWYDAMFRYGADITGKFLVKVRGCVTCSMTGCERNGVEVCIEGDVSFNAYFLYWSFTRTLLNGGKCFKL